MESSEFEKQSGEDMPGQASSGDTLNAEELKQSLAAEKERAEDYLASLQRTQADFVNYKRRTEQERQELAGFAGANIILNLLPVLDDLERAMEAVPSKYKQHDWVKGVRLVERKFKSSLETLGVKPVKAVGEPFDPNYHEAFRQDKGPEGIVLDEFQKGYTLNDKLLRPARVVVGNGEEETKEEE